MDFGRVPAEAEMPLPGGTAGETIVYRPPSAREAADYTARIKVADGLRKPDRVERPVAQVVDGVERIVVEVEETPPSHDRVERGAVAESIVYCDIFDRQVLRLTGVTVEGQAYDHSIPEHREAVPLQARLLAGMKIALRMNLSVAARGKSSSRSEATETTSRTVSVEPESAPSPASS